MPPKKSAATGQRSSAATSTSAAKPSANMASKRKRDADEADDHESNASSKRAKSTPVTATSTRPKRQNAGRSTATTSAKEDNKKSRATTKKTTTTTTTRKAQSSTKSKAPSKAKAAEAAATTTTKKGPGRPSKTPTAPSKKAAAGRPPTKAAAKPAKVAKPLPEINSPPTRRLDVLVFGAGDSGELGLGSGKNVIDVKRPRNNVLLDANTVGVVQLAAGGMHCLALTHDHQIYTWGVNDQGALGRDTQWEGGLRDINEDSGDSESEGGNDLNPRETTPTAIDSACFPPNTRFSQVVASDSASFALTTTGLVYGWGTFRANEGILGFQANSDVQRTPVLVEGLKDIIALACGANHVIALNSKGTPYTFGSGQQMQLGRKPVERTRASGLTPRTFGLARKGIKQIGAGAYTGFAVDKNDNVYAWGLNSFGELGIRQNAGRDEAVIGHPTIVAELSKRGVHSINGGEHHSVAVASNGDCLVWGRADGGQLGIDIQALPEDAVVKDSAERIRIVIDPQSVPELAGRTAAVAAGSDHCVAATTDGQAWTWGFGATYQLGHGSDDDINRAQQIQNTATNARKITGAQAGGQFSMITAAVDGDGDVKMNGSA